MSILFQPIKTAACVNDTVIVGFSGGKDSICALDLCCRYFKTVHVYFMYLVPGLSFQEAQLRWYEQRYGLQIHRVPHPMLSTWLRWGVFRKENFAIPEISFADVTHYLRVHFDAYWFAGGERIADSIVRRAMMKRSGSIDTTRGRFYPLAHWKKSDVVNYIKQKRLKMAPEYPVLGYSFRSLDPQDMVKIRQFYPEDFERIKRLFPFVEAGCVKYEIEKRDKENRSSEVCDGDLEAVTDP